MFSLKKVLSLPVAEVLFEESLSRETVAMKNHSFGSVFKFKDITFKESPAKIYIFTSNTCKSSIKVTYFFKYLPAEGSTTR